MPESLGLLSWASQLPISGWSVSWPEHEGLAGSVLRAECGKRTGVCLSVSNKGTSFILLS